MSQRTGIQWCDHNEPVPGFPGYTVTRAGAVFGPRGKVLRPGGSQRPIVTLYRDGRPHARQVSHLVLECFVGAPPFEGACALHENDNAWDNRLANLRWGTRSENKDDERRNRGRVSGRAPLLASASDEDLNAGSAREVARRLGVAHTVVLNERRRRRG